VNPEPFFAVLDSIEKYAPALAAIGTDAPPAPRWDQDWFPRLDAAAAYALVRSEPPRRIVLLTVADRQRARVCAQATLATDPRVLRRPAPVFRDTAIGLEVEFALLPDLVPGEIEHVQALIRAAARST